METYENSNVDQLPRPPQTKTVTTQTMNVTTLDQKVQTNQEIQDQTTQTLSSENQVSVDVSKTYKTAHQITEKVLKRRKSYNTEQFLIKWKDCPSSSNSWVNSMDLDAEAKTYIDNFSHNICGSTDIGQTPSNVHGDEQNRPDTSKRTIAMASQMDSTCTRNQRARPQLTPLPKQHRWEPAPKSSPRPTKNMSCIQRRTYPLYKAPAKHYRYSEYVMVNVTTFTNDHDAEDYNFVYRSTDDIRSCLYDLYDCHMQDFLPNADINKANVYFSDNISQGNYLLGHEIRLNELSSREKGRHGRRVMDKIEIWIDISNL